MTESTITDKATTTTVYGIKNCDTMKKALGWLDTHGIEFVFHDYKQSGISEQTLAAWVERLGLAKLVNRRGTTWRKLSDNDKEKFGPGKPPADAITMLRNHPSMIKRPIIVRGEACLSGFSEADYSRFFEN
ncbi:MAG: arsenate reductase [Gammaproteobacteria bacterium]|nr:MAG: arsenate reductase [Gammaproteobacteria bacterium]